MYIDDVIIYSKSVQEHIRHVDEVLTALNKAGVALNMEKCTFFMFSATRDVYLNLRLWSVSPHLSRALDELNLDTALGCAANVAEFRRLLGVIESTNYAAMPSSWTCRGDVNAQVGANQNRRGWGCQGPGADFIYYDPWRRVAISEEQAKQ